MLGRMVREHRLRSGLSVAQLAASAGIRRESLSRIESGKKQVGAETLMRLADQVTLPASEWVSAFLAQETRVHPLLIVARQLIDRGDLGNASLVLRRARILIHLGRHHRQRGEVYRQLGRCAYGNGAYEEALRWLEKAERAAVHGADLRERAVAHYNCGLTLGKVGYPGASLARFDLAIAAADSSKDQARAGWSRLSKANVLLRMHSYREALDLYRAAASLLRGDVWLFDCRLGELICVAELSSPRTALELVPDLERLASDPERRGKLHHNIAVLHRRLGEFDVALGHLELALEAKGSVGSLVPNHLAELCLCQVAAGDRAGARLTLQRFADLEESKEPQDIWAMNVLSSILYGRAVGELPAELEDGHDHRLKAALSLLLAGEPARVPVP